MLQKLMSRTIEHGLNRMRRVRRVTATRTVWMSHVRVVPLYIALACCLVRPHPSFTHIPSKNCVIIVFNCETVFSKLVLKYCFTIHRAYIIRINCHFSSHENIYDTKNRAQVYHFPLLRTHMLTFFKTTKCLPPGIDGEGEQKNL